MKKLHVVLAAAGLTASLGAYATLPTDAAPFSLNIPNLKSGIQVTLEGLLVRPTSDAIDYATLNTFSNNSGTDFFNIANSQSAQTVNPKYDFGFRVGLGYVFPDSGNDVQLNWTHFQHSYTNSTDIGNAQVLTTSFGTPILNPSLFGLDGDANASSTTKFQFDAIDLTVGQYVNIGTRLQTRLFGGLRYAYVKQNQDNNYSASYIDPTDPTGDAFFTYSESDDYHSKFNGLGPRLGFQAAYNVYDCFGVTGSIAGSLLVGKVKSSTNNSATATIIDTEDGDTFPISVGPNGLSNDAWRVVPEIDARLGLNYTWLFTNQSALTLEAGYQVTQYFNAVDQLQTNLSNGLGTSYTRETSNVGYDGPYLSLNYKL